MDIIKLINDKGNRGIFHKDDFLFDVATIATSADIAAERAMDTRNLSDPAFRNYFYFTSNFCMYVIEKTKSGKEEFLYFGKLTANPLFSNMEEACRQMLAHENYRVPREDVKKVFDSVKSGDTHRTRLASLKLKEFDPEFAYFEIDTRYYWQSVKNGGLNRAQRDFAEKVFGEGKNFNRYMYLLTYHNIRKTRIYVLNPAYVMKHHKAGAGIARLCLLCDFYYSSNFYANIRGIDMGDVLISVLRKDMTLETACRKLIEAPEKTIDFLKSDHAVANELAMICKITAKQKNKP